MVLLTNFQTREMVNIKEYFLLVSVTLLISCIFVVEAVNQAACFQKVDYGTCKENSRRYYFDHTTGSCKSFTYKGCRGNSNNFQSSSDCEKFKKSCLAGPCFQKVDYGNCKEHVGRYYFNYKTTSCTVFSYKGCRGNSNNFPNWRECEVFKKSCIGGR